MGALRVPCSVRMLQSCLTELVGILENLSPIVNVINVLNILS